MATSSNRTVEEWDLAENRINQWSTPLKQAWSISRGREPGGSGGTLCRSPLWSCHPESMFHDVLCCGGATIAQGSQLLQAFRGNLRFRPGLGTPIHKYTRNRPPLHPRQPCCAPCDVLAEYASVARLVGVAQRRSRYVTVFTDRSTWSKRERRRRSSIATGRIAHVSGQ